MSDSSGVEIALVGHCGPDAFALQSSVMGFVPGAVVHRVNSMDELEAKMGGLSLLLVNRVLDGRFGTDSGIELIRGLGEGTPPAMLITNFEESMREAVEAGAVPGFGKSSMRSAQAEGALKGALGIG